MTGEGDRAGAMARALAYFDEGGFEEEIARRVAFRTESQKSDSGPELHRYLDEEMIPAFEGMGFTVKPCGSVAYKLALVAAGLADATWTLVPKHEWDVAAGVALVNAAGGAVRRLSGEAPRFNAQKPKLDGLIATGGALRGPVDELLGVGR